MSIIQFQCTLALNKLFSQFVGILCNVETYLLSASSSLSITRLSDGILSYLPVVCQQFVVKEQVCDIHLATCLFDGILSYLPVVC